MNDVVLAVPVETRLAARENSPLTAWEQLVELFLAGRPTTTTRTYREALQAFTLYMGAASVAIAAAMLLGRERKYGQAIGRAYQAWLLDERGLAPATVNLRMTALRSLSKLAVELELSDWTLTIRSLKATPLRDTRGPGRDGVEAMLEQLDPDTAKGARDRALLLLMYGRGLRRAEVAELDLEHWASPAVMVRRKGLRERVPITVPTATAAAIDAWLEHRGDTPGPLFQSLNHNPAHRGKRLTGVAIHTVISRLGDKAGIRVRPHGLRHAAITRVLDLTNGNLRVAQAFSGHASADMLKVYDDNRRDLGGEVAEDLVADLMATT